MIAVVDAPFNVHAEIRRPMHLPVVSDLAQHEDDGKHHSGLQALSLEVGQPWLGLELQAPFDHWDKTDLEASHPPRSAPPAHAAPLWVAAAPHTFSFLGPDAKLTPGHSVKPWKAQGTQAQNLTLCDTMGAPDGDDQAHRSCTLVSAAMFLCS